jgi:hypothetical protein
MFEVGDKVVCVNNIWINGNRNPLKIGNIYTIEEILLYSTVHIVVINNIEYRYDRFISLEEDRRRKLEKIRRKIC